MAMSAGDMAAIEACARDPVNHALLSAGGFA